MRAVISFHAIDRAKGPLSYPPERFRLLVETLLQDGIPIVDLATLLDADVTTGVAFTFDDGIQSVHRHALPVIRDHKIPAHLFLTTGYVAGSNQWPGQPSYAQRYAMLDWDEVGQLSASGVLIEGHTARHGDLRTMSDEEILSEIEVSNSEIESRLGRRPRYFAYPYGLHDARVRKLAASVYDGCCTTELGYLPDKVRRESIPRLDSHYLRSPLVFGSLDRPVTRSYLAVRRLIRRLRGVT